MATTRTKQESKQVDLGEIEMQAVVTDTQVDDATLWSVFKVDPNAETPTAGSEYSAGYDLRACVSAGKQIDTFTTDNTKQQKTAREFVEFGGKVGFFIEPGERMLIPTGLQFQIHPDYWVGVYPRSGISIKMGLTLINCVGVVDSDYCGEVMITLVNTSRTRIFIENGERLCQAILHKRYQTTKELSISKKLQTQVTSRAGGFGSTGSK